LAAGLRPDPLKELKRSPYPLAAVKGLGPREGRGKEEGKGRGGDGRREGRDWEGREEEGGEGK